MAKRRPVRRGIWCWWGQVPWLPPALPEGLITEPGDHPHDMHCGGIQQWLEMCACQPAIPTLTQVKALSALREATLALGLQSIVDVEVSRLLPLAGGLDDLVVRLQSNGKLV